MRDVFDRYSLNNMATEDELFVFYSAPTDTTFNPFDKKWQTGYEENLRTLAEKAEEKRKQVNKNCRKRYEKARLLTGKKYKSRVENK